MSSKMIAVIARMEKSVTSDIEDLYDVAFCSDYTYTPEEAQAYIDAVTRIAMHAAFHGAVTSLTPTTASISEVVADHAALLRECANAVEESLRILSEEAFGEVAI